LANLGNDLDGYVYQFTIGAGATDLTWDGVVKVMHPVPTTCGPIPCNAGYVSTITTIQEGPDGTLYAIGSSAPRFAEDDYVSDYTDAIFTTPTLAEIPTSALWQQSTNPDTVAATEITGSDLALPISAVLIVPSPSTPVLTDAVSRKTHGGTGAWDIDVGVGDIESRSQQVGTANPNELVIVATFDKDVAVLGGTAAVTTDVGAVSSVVPGSTANQVEITISSLPLFGQMNLGFVDNPSAPAAGIVDASTPTDPASASRSTLCLRIIVGDYDNQARTSFLDFSKIKNAGYLNQLVNSVDIARADFDCSGRPGFLDFSKVKNSGLINKTAVACTATIVP
jgi:hypothetical protein